MVKKGQEVPVELAQMIVYWTCPKCRHNNEENIGRNAGSVQELHCDNCDTVLMKQCDFKWVAE